MFRCRLKLECRGRESQSAYGVSLSREVPSPLGRSLRRKLCPFSEICFSFCPPGPLSELGQLPIAAFSGNKSFSFSLRLRFSNDVCSAPIKLLGTKNQRHGFIAG